MDPVPFEIVERDGAKHASNGALTVTVLDADGKLFRRRAIKADPSPPPAEGVLPRLNELAGTLLEQADMPPEEIARRLMDIAQSLTAPKHMQRIEWAVARLGDVSVYVDGQNVIVTRNDLFP